MKFLTAKQSLIRQLTIQSPKRLAIILLLVITAHISAAGQALSASGIVASVNGEAITYLDLSKRTKLLTLFNAVKGNSASIRKKVLDKLIEEKLKVSVARQYDIKATKSEIDAQFAALGQQLKLNSKQFAQALQQNGVDPNELRKKMAGDFMWQKFVLAYNNQKKLSERKKQILNLTNKNKGPVYRYNLKQIIFVISGKSSKSNQQQRAREARGLQANRSINCNNIEARVRGLRDVVVKNFGIKTSSEISLQMPPAVSIQLNKTPVGRMTAPMRNDRGYVMFLICNKARIGGTAKSGGSGIEQKLDSELQSVSDDLMKQIRKNARIIMHN